MSEPRVVMMGAFPPPVSGAAKINGIVFETLRNSGAEVTKVDLSTTTLAHSRSVLYHLRRLRRNLAGLLQGWRRGDRDATLYIVPDGGAGAWYTLAHVRALGRSYGSLVIHHHTCRYVEQRNRAIAMLTRVRNDKAIHVFLSTGMAEAFQRQYGRVRYLIASNARFVEEEAGRQAEPRPHGPLRLGHLSNLCRDKGFSAVADAYDAVRRARIDAELHLAGPVIEPAVQVRLDRLRRDHGDLIRYQGQVAGATKQEFYRGIDLFLFPTQWRQEAAPIVIYEALAAGVPVLATDRGMIAEIVQAPRGAICPREGDFSEFVLDYLHELDLTADSRVQRASKIKMDVRDECSRSRSEYQALMTLLGAPAAAEIGSS